MRVALQISTSTMGRRFLVDREGGKGVLYDQFRNIILRFEGHDLGGVHITLNPGEAKELAQQVLSALEQ